VRDELDKTLTGQHAAKGMRLLLSSGLLDQECRVRDSEKAQTVPILPEVRHLAGLQQNPRYHRLDAWEHTLATVEAIRAEPLLRWAALLHDVAKGLPGVRSINEWGEPVEHQHEVAGAEMATAIADRLKFPSLWRKRLPWLVRQHLRLPPTEKEAVIRWLRRRASEFKTAEELSAAMEQLLELHRADRLAGHRIPGIPEWERFNVLLKQILHSVPFYPSQLLLSGEEIAKKIGKGPAVGRFQRTLLNRIHAGELMNMLETQQLALEKKAARLNDGENK
jgi:tRNA nucleotidyltransferase/poly(A) polymerase